MKKTLGLLFFGIFLTGCYANSLTMVGPATGVASGKLTETATSTTINHIVKKKTGKTPFEHVLSEKQIKTLDTAKTKINPCIKSPELCSLIRLFMSVVMPVYNVKSLQSKTYKYQGFILLALLD